MRNLIFLAIFSTCHLPCISQTTQMIRDVQWVKQHIEESKDLVIFHIGNVDDYEKEHLSNAVFIEGDDYTFADDTHVFDMPPLDEFKSFVESKGLTNESQILIYASTTWVPMVTRLYFTFDYLGMGDRTYILDGGLVAWKAAGGEVTSNQSVPKKGGVSFKPDKSLIVDKDYMVKAMESQSAKIVDCRASVYYDGIEMNSMHGGRKGHIPGAKTVPYTSLTIRTSGTVKFKKPEQIAEILQAQGLQKDDEILLYCHIGMQLTVVYTTAKMLGYTNVKIYDGSFHEWGPDQSLPVEL